MSGYNSEPTFKRPYTSSEALLPLEAVLALPVTDIPSRGVDKAAAEHFDVRKETDASGEPIAFYFVYRENGVPIGYKKRYKTPTGKRAFVTYGDVSVKSDLWGSHKVSSARKLFVTEGEFDAAALFQAIMKRAQERGYEGPPPAVVSIGLGTSSAAQQMLENVDYLKGFKEIILVFDSDAATPEEARSGIKKGREAVGEVVTSLPDLNIKQVLLPLKDANAMVLEGRGKELAELALFQAKEWLPESLQGYSSDIEKEIDYLETPMKRGTYLDFLPKTSSILRGIRPSEMTIVIAPSGVGKSSLSKQVAFSLLKAEPDARIANFYLEEGILKAKQSFMALYHNVRLAELRENPNLLTREQKREFLEWQGDRLTFYDCDKAGILSPDSVERMIRYCAVMGYTHIIFDHLHFVLTGAEDSSVHKIDNLLTKLSLIPRGYPVHLWVVAHITKKGQYPIPKDPQTKEPIYPHFMPVNADDARGSSSFRQLTWNLLCLEPEIINEAGEKGRVRVVVRKNREWGDELVGDVLQYNKTTGLLQ